jgi:hypothetical protein
MHFQMDESGAVHILCFGEFGRLFVVIPTRQRHVDMNKNRDFLCSGIGSSRYLKGAAHRWDRRDQFARVSLQFNECREIRDS